MINRLYLVHDEDYSYKIVVSAQNAKDALKKLNTFLKETKQVGDLWRDLKWVADLCDNDKVLEQDDKKMRGNISEGRKYRDLILNQLKSEIEISDDQIGSIMKRLNNSTSDELERVYEAFERFGVQVILDIISE